MEHPEFEVIENDEEISIHFRRITPIYPATEGLSQRVLRSLIYRLLEEYEDDDLVTVLPSTLTDGSSAAWRDIHFPQQRRRSRGRGNAGSAGFCNADAASWRRARSTARGRCARGEGNCSMLFCARFLDLTNAQARVIEELRADLCSPFPMNRLLQGDVGSGKTVVAIAAMLLAVEAGFQAALMAPTQILAEQHYVVLRRWLEPLGVRIALRTAARQEGSLPWLRDRPRGLVASPALELEGLARPDRS
jgi:ATP-dependent DNA helicase RecG